VTRAEEIAEIRAILVRTQLFREFIATQVTDDSPSKARILEQADANIAKAERYLRELESPDADTPVMLSAPRALQ
jgi:hypothetical protein